MSADIITGLRLAKAEVVNVLVDADNKNAYKLLTKIIERITKLESSYLPSNEASFPGALSPIPDNGEASSSDYINTPPAQP